MIFDEMNQASPGKFQFKFWGMLSIWSRMCSEYILGIRINNMCKGAKAEHGKQCEWHQQEKLGWKSGSEKEIRNIQGKCIY